MCSVIRGALILAFAAISVSCAASNQSEMVNSFETSAQLRQLVPSNVQLAVVTGHGVTDGRHALQVAFDPTPWPNVSFHKSTVWSWPNDALLVSVTNPGTRPAQFWVRVDDSASANGETDSLSGGTIVPPGITETVGLPLRFVDPMKYGMQALPAISRSYVAMSPSGAGPLNLNHIVTFQFYMHDPGQTTTLIFDNVRVLSLPSSDLAKIIDRYGQYTGASWPSKVKTDADMESQWRTEQKDLKAHPRLSSRDTYGGWQDGPKLTATGYFRTQKYQGLWSLVDPEGRLFFSLGMDSVSQSESTLTTGREQMFTWLPASSDPLAQFSSHVTEVHAGPVKEGDVYNFYGANLYRKYGKRFDAIWRRITLARLPSWGFNTIGNWADSSVITKSSVPYVASAWVSGNHKTVSSGSDYWAPMPDPFDPQFAIDAANNISSVARTVKGDPYCIGWFVDNEMSWGGGARPQTHFGLAYGAMSLDQKTSPAKAAFLAALRNQYGSIDALNRAWATNYAAWTVLEAPTILPSNPTPAQTSDMSSFLTDFATQYFTVVRNTIREYDPGHLYLGCRFAAYTPEAVAAATGICDVTSFNIYATSIDSKWDFLKPLDRPCIVGEFQFGALDSGMFNASLVPTISQQGRAIAFKTYVESVLAQPEFVGCHWFQYTDESAVGRWFDGENFNIGFTNVADNPYPDMVAASRTVAKEMYLRRFGASTASSR